MHTYTLKNEQDRYGDHNIKCWYICKVEKKYVPQSSMCTKVYLEKWFTPPSIHLEKVPAPPQPTLKNVLPPPANAEQVYASSIAWSLIFKD